MSTYKGAKIAETRIYDNPDSPENSDYRVVLPITVMDAVKDPVTGKSLSELVKPENVDLLIPEATLTVKGIVRKASAAETLLGNEVNAYVSPEYLHAVIKHIFDEGGYITPVTPYEQTITTSGIWTPPAIGMYLFELQAGDGGGGAGGAGGLGLTDQIFEITGGHGGGQGGGGAFVSQVVGITSLTGIQINIGAGGSGGMPAPGNFEENSSGFIQGQGGGTGGATTIPSLSLTATGGGGGYAGDSKDNYTGISYAGIGGAGSGNGTNGANGQYSNPVTNQGYYYTYSGDPTDPYYNMQYWWAAGALGGQGGGKSGSGRTGGGKGGKGGEFFLFPGNTYSHFINAQSGTKGANGFVKIIRIS